MSPQDEPKICEGPKNCIGHELFEERSKLVDKIPGLLNFRANTKGGGAAAALFVGIIVAVMFGFIENSAQSQERRQETFEEKAENRMEKHEELVSRSLQSQEAQTRALLQVVSRLESTVASFVDTQKIIQEQNAKTIERNSIKLTELERVIIRKYGDPN